MHYLIFLSSETAAIIHILHVRYLKESIKDHRAGNSVGCTVVVPPACMFFICEKLCVIYFQSSYCKLKTIHNRRESERKQSIFTVSIVFLPSCEINWKELELALEHGGCTSPRNHFDSY